MALSGGRWVTDRSSVSGGHRTMFLREFMQCSVKFSRTLLGVLQLVPSLGQGSVRIPNPKWDKCNWWDSSLTQDLTTQDKPLRSGFILYFFMAIVSFAYLKKMYWGDVFGKHILVNWLKVLLKSCINLVSNVLYSKHLNNSNVAGGGLFSQEYCNLIYTVHSLRFQVSSSEDYKHLCWQFSCCLPS